MNRKEWWVDYLENEVTPTERVDMELLLAYSTADQEILASLQAVRSSIESLDPLIQPKGQDFYQSLHARIMSEVVSNVEVELPQNKPILSDQLKTKVGH